MKSANYMISFVAIALILSLGAFAKDKDKQEGKFTLSNTVRVGTTQLQPGDYKAEWSGPANALKVDILENGKTVATTDGKIKDLPKRADYDSVTLKNLDNNTKTIDEIGFRNRTEELVLGGE
jgi:hypothetical protein